MFTLPKRGLRSAAAVFCALLPGLALAQAVPTYFMLTPWSPESGVPAPGWSAVLMLPATTSPARITPAGRTSPPLKSQWLRMLEAPDFDAEVRAVVHQSPSPTPLSPRVTQDVQPNPATNQPTISVTPSFIVAQAPETRNAWYDRYIDIDAVANTIVHAVQNITTVNTVTITQTCSGTCSQVASPVTTAATVAGQTVNAGASNAQNVVQTNTGAPGSGGTAATQATLQPVSTTDVVAQTNAATGNATTIVQNAGSGDQRAVTNAEAATVGDQTINAGSRNDATLVQQ